MKGVYPIPVPINEPVLSYAPGSPERAEVKGKLTELLHSKVDIPMSIGGEDVYTQQKVEIRPPHDLNHRLGHFNEGDKVHVEKAISAALMAKAEWAALSWQNRAAIFLKAADLLTGPYRAKMVAATMLGQSKNVFQAEIDAACELADFFRFGVQCMKDIYQIQPQSSPGTWNYNDYRPLEGFVFALTPFNFTSIAGNLPCAPAMLGNTVLWKPASSAVYSAYFLTRLWKEAGLPDGVINFIPGPGGQVVQAIE